MNDWLCLWEGIMIVVVMVVIVVVMQVERIEAGLTIFVPPTKPNTANFKPRVLLLP